MVKRAFVTGSTGFLGLNLISELSKSGWDITALYVPSADLNYLSKYNVKKVCGDISDFEFLCKVIPEKVDAVFHAAGNTSAWSKNNKAQYNDNVNGTRNMVNASIKKKVKRFIFTSSISAYGYHSGIIIDENTVSNAMSCKMNYNKTKFLAENIVKDAIKLGLNPVILNPCNIIGPYDTNNWTKQFLKPVYLDKMSVIPPGNAMWCHVNDVVDAHINAVEKGVKGENYLLGGIEARFVDLINEIRKLLGKKSSDKVQSKFIMRSLVYVLTIKSFFDGKEPQLTIEKYNRAVGNIRCNFDKAHSVLGYKTTSIEKMIKDSYDWLMKENILTGGY